MKTGKNKKLLKNWSINDLLEHCRNLTISEVYTTGNLKAASFDTILAAIQWKSEKDKQEFKPDYSSDYWRLKI